MSLLIVEGVTGVGKSSTIRALQARGATLAFDEETTFGPYMDELAADPAMSNAARTRRFDAVLDRLESNRVPHTGISIVERCWFSNVALGDDWSIHDRNDERAAALGFRLALLDVPDELFATRSLYRAEYDRRDWQAFNEMYGSEAAAIAAIRASQQRRREALTRTRMPTLVLDTAAMDWPAYASVLEVFAA